MITVQTVAHGRFAFPSDDHTFTAHDDGDLTLRAEGTLVAVFARGQWVAITNTEDDQ